MKGLPIAIAVIWTAVSVPTAGQAPALPSPDGIARLLRTLEQGLESGDPQQYMSLLASSANRVEALAFATAWFDPRMTRAAVRERDRQPLLETSPGTAYELNVDIFTEFGRQGRLGTWRLDVRRTGSGEGGEPDWQIGAQAEVSAIEGLHQLQLNPQKQFLARNLIVSAEDFELKVPEGAVFASEIPDGMTALVVLGRGELVFSPAPEAERRQVKIFSGSETLQTRAEAAFIRLNPQEARSRIAGTLEARPVDRRAWRRAAAIFEEEVRKSFALDLRDLSPDLWSTIPSRSDFVAEIRTSRYDTLTYTRMASDPEDISLFDRRRRRSISLYPSKDKLARRGPFYSEDDLVDYDVLDYDVEARFQPEREWLDGRTTLRVRIKASALGSFSLRLARTLTLDSVVSRQLGRLLSLRGLNQNNIIVQLPGAVTRGTVLDLVVTYAGRLSSQAPTREALAAQAPQGPDQAPGQRQGEESIVIPREPSWLYSNNSYWYAQSPVSDYATARLRLSVPDGYASVATGALAEPPQLLPAAGTKALLWRQSTFVARRPVRYLSWVISRFVHADETTATIAAPSTDGVDPPLGAPPQAGPEVAGFRKIDVGVDANPMQLRRARELSARAVEMLSFYGSLVGEFPYPTFTLAVVEHELPGGHSPPYFAQLHQPPPLTPVRWQNDPVYFGSYPDFFLAHELAHQWWGQAVGWRNFHEQWLSEGFAQYFALLYAQRQRPEVFNNLVRQLRRWSMNESDQGPVYLGYRLGHIKGDSRVFRALVYNKGAAVLHMLRRLVGDEAFFRSVRRFYTTWRFAKAGTEDLRATFEAETRQPLEQFFAGWIYGQDIPRIRFDWRIEGAEAVLQFEQLGAEVFVVPLTVSLQFADRTTREEIVVVDYKTVDVRIPVSGTLRAVDVNRDEAALAEFVR